MSSIALYGSYMEQRQRGNPPGNTNAHVATNLRRARQSAGLDLRELASRIQRAGRAISHSAISKIENGERRVDVDDLVVFAYVLDTTPAALLTPPDDAPVPTGLPDGRYLDEEIWAWMRDLSPLIAGRLVWFWYGQAESTRRRIQLNRNLVEMYATKGEGEGEGITAPAEYEARIAKDEDRLLFIKARIVALDPAAADRIAQEDPSRWGPAPSTDTP